VSGATGSSRSGSSLTCGKRNAGHAVGLRTRPEALYAPVEESWVVAGMVASGAVRTRVRAAACAWTVERWWHAG
jgi:hypothetical protein